MAQLPVYRQQGNISPDLTGRVRDSVKLIKSDGMTQIGNALQQLAAKWQESKDAVENLDGRNKLNSGVSAILDEAANFNDYSTPEELSQKQQELTQKMNNLVPDIVSGFSNNQKAKEFEINGQYIAQQNIYKLQEIFRSKYGDMYNANLLETSDNALKGFTQTGDAAYKQEYFDAIDTGVQAGYLDRTQAEKLKLSTDSWNYDFVYSKLLENPYYKANDEVMSKIDPVKQRTLRNFARSEQKRILAEAIQAATNDYYINPTQENLNRLYKLNPKLRSSKKLSGYKKDLESVRDNQPNFNSVTTFEGMSDALGAVKELVQIDTSTPEGKREYAQKAAQVGTAINKLNKNGTISEKDRGKLFNMVYNDLMDDNFKNQIKNMPNLSREWSAEFNRDYQKLQADVIKADMEFIKVRQSGADKNSKAYKDAEAKYQKAWKARHYYLGYNDVANKNRRENAPVGVNQKILDYQRAAAKGMLNAYMQGNVQEANKIKEQYGQQMVRLKYWNIPALQKQNLKAGDKFTVNGKVYSFQGFSKNDVIVEVH